MLKYNGKDITYRVYPGGEVAIDTRISEAVDHCPVIEASLECSDDIMALMQLKDIHDRVNGDPVTLMLLYAPYARQDRVIEGISGNQSLSVKLFADIINSMNFKTVVLNDPHSDVISALINNVYVNDKEYLFRFYLSEMLHRFGHNLCFLSPDLGAYKELSRLAQSYCLPLASCIKERDPETGNIIITDILNGDLLKNKDVIILDDICDGGGTFLAIADGISHKPNSLHLAVTNGIFSQGIEKLLFKFDSVSAYNVFQKVDTSDVNCFDLNGVKTFTKKEIK